MFVITSILNAIELNLFLSHRVKNFQEMMNEFQEEVDTYREKEASVIDHLSV